MIDPERKAAIDDILERLRGKLELSEEVLAQHTARDQRAMEAALVAISEIRDSYALLARVNELLSRRA